MLDERIRRELNRWVEQGRSRGLEKRYWETTRQMIELLNPGPHENLLDLGCATGWATRVLAAKASRGIVVGLDISDRMLQQAKAEYRNPSNVFFAVADAARVPCRDDAFNAVLSVDAIYYYPDLQGALAEAFRVLAPGGRAFFLVNYYQENVHSHEWARYVDFPLHLLGTEDYVRLLAGCGFQNVAHRRLVDSTPLPEDWVPSRWFTTREDHMKFRAEGALLLSAEK